MLSIALALSSALLWGTGDFLGGLASRRFALAWVLSRPGVASAVIGAMSSEQIVENAAAADLALEPATLAAIESAVAG